MGFLKKLFHSLHLFLTLTLPAQAPPSSNLCYSTEADLMLPQHTKLIFSFPFSKIRPDLTGKKPRFALLTVLNYFAMPLEGVISFQEKGSSGRKPRVPAHLHAQLHAQVPASVSSVSLCRINMLLVCRVAAQRYSFTSSIFMPCHSNQRRQKPMREKNKNKKGYTHFCQINFFLG